MVYSVLTDFMIDLAAAMARDDYETRRKRQAQGIEKAKKLDSKPLFSSAAETLEQSLSRGKQELEIDESWNSKVCEKLRSTLSQTTN